MTEMQSQIGICELERLDDWNLANRKRNAAVIIEGLKDHPLVMKTPVNTKERQNAFWWVPLILDADKLTCTVAEFCKAVAAEGTPCYGVQWPEMYRERAFVEKNGFGNRKYPFKDPAARDVDYTKFDCKQAQYLADRTMSFFPHPVYSVEQMEACVTAFNKVAKAYMK
jgi:dTDP-4-amino-4,6-dideoxygalactose transaminase